MAKVRRVDFYPDEYLSGVAGKLNAEQQSIYWMICTRIYSDGRDLVFDDALVDLLARDCMLRRPKIRNVLNHLIEIGKLHLNGAKLSNNRAVTELEKAGERIETARENGEKGGRPPKIPQENQEKVKPSGFSDEKLTTNHQPPTTNQEKDSLSDFDEFWSVCPRKVGKGGAYRAYQTARKSVCAETLLAAMRRHAAAVAGKDTQYIPHPRTWLSQKRWLDEADAAPAPQYQNGFLALQAEMQREKDQKASVTLDGTATVIPEDYL